MDLGQSFIISILNMGRYSMNDNKKPLEELELLEGKVDAILEAIKIAKSKSIAEKDLTKDELDMIVEKVNDLQDIVSKRRDVGH